MPEVIEKGYFYIAQPPLYKVKRGNSGETYLKDDYEMEEYLINAALGDLKLRAGDGSERAGNDLYQMLMDVRLIRGAY